MLRRFLVFLAASGLTLLLILTATIAILDLTFTPGNVKKWLKGSAVYSTVTDNILKQSQDALAKSTDGSQSPLNQPEIQAAVKDAFSPAFLQTSTENFIDGLTPWLNGKTAKPTFSIDVSSAKTKFIESLANYARNRYAALPVCAPSQIKDLSNVDVMTIPCQVPGFSIDGEINKATANLSGGGEFLPNQVITADNLTTGEGDNKKPVFEQAKNVPKVYKWAHIAPFILGFLALVAAAIIVFLSTERRKGVRRVAASLAFVTALLFFNLWVTTYGVKKADEALAKHAAENQGLTNTALAIVKELKGTLNRNTLIFAIAFLVLIGALIIYLLATKDKKPKSPGSGEASGKDEKEKTEEPKAETPAEQPPKPKPKLIQ